MSNYTTYRDVNIMSKLPVYHTRNTTWGGLLCGPAAYPYIMPDYYCIPLVPPRALLSLCLIDATHQAAAAALPCAILSTAQRGRKRLL